LAGIATLLSSSFRHSRPGADFDVSGTLHVRQSKGGKARHVALSDDGIALFEQLTAGRAADERIFTRPDGKPLEKSQQQRPLLMACEGANIRWLWRKVVSEEVSLCSTIATHLDVAVRVR